MGPGPPRVLKYIPSWNIEEIKKDIQKRHYYNDVVKKMKEQMEREDDLQLLMSQNDDDDDDFIESDESSDSPVNNKSINLIPSHKTKYAQH